MKLRKSTIPYSPINIKGDDVPASLPRYPVLEIKQLQYEGEVERVAATCYRFFMNIKAKLLVEDAEDMTPFIFPYEIEEVIYVFDQEDSNLEEELVHEENSVCYILPGKEIDLSELAYLALHTELPSHLVKNI